MKMDRVREAECLEDVASRLNVPECMLLRANRLYSGAWLLPGREIAVPEAGFCERDDFECPVMALNRVMEA